MANAKKDVDRIRNEKVNQMFKVSPALKIAQLEPYNGDVGKMNRTQRIFLAKTIISGGVYTGYVKATRPYPQDGLGVMLYPSGSVYEGNFARGKRQGHGRFVESNGSVYTGEWSDDV
jgi:hypothetical protein